MEIGIELEYPIAGPNPLEDKSRSSSSLVREINDDINSFFGAESMVTRDPTVGLELVSEPLDPLRARSWYRESIDIIETEYGRPHGPCGLMEGSTAGLHLHVDNFSREQARKLYEFSTEPWLKAFVCSSVVADEAPNYRVFRGNYAEETFDRGRYSVVNCRSERQGHYEWRLVEPVTSDHFDRIVRFLELFRDRGPKKAKRYVMSVIDDEPEVVTSIKRAAEIGVDRLEEPEPEPEPEVSRTPHPATESWYLEVRQDNGMPYIYQVELPEGWCYYVFHSHHDDIFTVEGVDFRDGWVLSATTLNRETDPDIVSRCRDALDEERNGGRRRDTPPKTEAGEYLKDVVKEAL